MYSYLLLALGFLGLLGSALTSQDQILKIGLGTIIALLAYAVWDPYNVRTLQAIGQIILFVERWMAHASLLLFSLLAAMLVCYFACRWVTAHQAQLAAYIERL